MRSTRGCFILILVAISWSCILGLQRPPPRYSQQFMPETSFTCRNKIVGSYYADAETDCQVFHVCVSVAGTIQDYKFLCPNDTAFDQESQTCADWYDVDCEAATLYYSSDNFDLYRIGSGFESLHYDHIRSDAEPQDHLQRSESSDAIRSSANSVNRLSTSTSYNTNSNNRDILRGSNSGNFYNRNNKDDDDDENEKSYKEEVNQDNRRKGGIRKVSRKQSYNYSPTTTTASPTTSKKSYNDNYYNGNIYNQRSTTYVTSTPTPTPTTTTTTTTTARPPENYNKNQNTQRYNIPSSTYRPSTTYQTYSSYQPSSTTAKITVYNTNPNYNSQNNVGSFLSSTTLKPSSYNPKIYPAYSQYPQSTTYQPSTNYQTNDYNNYQQRNYNNIQRGVNNNISYQSSTTAPTNYNNNYSNNNVQYKSSGTTQQDIPQTTTKYFNYANGNYAPTTYSPITKKYINGGSSTVGQTVLKNNDNGQYFDKTSQTLKSSSSQYHDSTRTPKKATQYNNNNYDSTSGARSYYVETSTGSLDIARQSIGIGFSPASINHLAEAPRTTTPAPRRPSSATTYNSNNFISTVQKTSQPSTTPRGNTYVSGSARPFTATTRFSSSSSTTVRPKKSSKKNDYDYAYYDNTGVLEYDGVDLEHVTSNKESTKIARN